MISITHNHEGVVTGVEVNETKFSAEAIALMASRLERAEAECERLRARCEAQDGIIAGLRERPEAEGGADLADILSELAAAQAQAGQLRAENERLRAIIDGPRVPRFEPDDASTAERLATVASSLAAMLIEERLREGASIEIPSLGITLTRDDLEGQKP